MPRMLATSCQVLKQGPLQRTQDTCTIAIAVQELARVKLPQRHGCACSLLKVLDHFRLFAADPSCFGVHWLWQTPGGWLHCRCDITCAPCLRPWSRQPNRHALYAVLLPAHTLAAPSAAQQMMGACCSCSTSRGEWIVMAGQEHGGQAQAAGSKGNGAEMNAEWESRFA